MIGRWFAAPSRVMLMPGAEITQRTYQVAHIALGQQHQAGELSIIEISDSTVALQLDMSFQQFPHISWRANHNVKRGHVGSCTGRPDRASRSGWGLSLS